MAPFCDAKERRNDNLLEAKYFGGSIRQLRPLTVAPCAKKQAADIGDPSHVILKIKFAICNMQYRGGRGYVSFWYFPLFAPERIFLANPSSTSLFSRLQMLPEFPL